VQGLEKYKSVIFDCDGVILQSNEIKTNAFRHALKNEPVELVDEFIDYHKVNGGISRYVKFEYYYRDIKRDHEYKSKVKITTERYGEIVLDKLMNADFVPGVIETILYLNDMGIKCFVVSGGDQNELHKIFMSRNIFDKFEKIYGSPVTKKEHVLTMTQLGLLGYPAIFFGDAYSDMDAALSNEIDFCFVSQFSDWVDGDRVVKDFGSKVINNFEDLMFSNKL